VANYCEFIYIVADKHGNYLFNAFTTTKFELGILLSSMLTYRHYMYVTYNPIQYTWTNNVCVYTCVGIKYSIHITSVL